MVAQLDKRYLQTGPGRVYSRLVSYVLFEGRPLTTRGRWINPLLQKQFERIARRAAGQPVDRPLFILGTGRSGTTILGKILSLHSEVGWLNEPKLMWHVARDDEDLNGNYTGKPARYRLTALDADDDVKRAMHNLYRSYLRASGNTRVLDKYPELIFRIPFVKAIFPDARFIFLVRNGYDTCASIDSWSARHGEAGPDSVITDWWGTNRRKWHYLVDQLAAGDTDLAPALDAIRDFDKQADMAAVEWLLTMREGLRARQQSPADMLLLRYEDLLTQPVDSMREVLEFCELAAAPAVIEYARENLRPPQHRDKALTLHPAIEEPFARTLAELGY